MKLQIKDPPFGTYALEHKDRYSQGFYEVRRMFPHTVSKSVRVLKAELKIPLPHDAPQAPCVSECTRTLHILQLDFIKMKFSYQIISYNISNLFLNVKKI